MDASFWLVVVLSYWLVDFKVIEHDLGDIGHSYYGGSFDKVLDRKGFLGPLHDFGDQFLDLEIVDVVCGAIRKVKCQQETDQLVAEEQVTLSCRDEKVLKVLFFLR